VSKGSVQWIKTVTDLLSKNLNGVINQTTLSKYADSIASKYGSSTSIHKCYMYSRGFFKHLYKLRMDTRLLAYLAIFEKPKVRRDIKLMTSRIITVEDIQNVITGIDNDITLSDDRKHQSKALILFLAYEGQRPLTVLRLTAGQFRQSLVMNPPVLIVQPWQDKNRMEHYVPLHPVVIPFIEKLIEGKSDNEVIFDLRRTQVWLQQTAIPLTHIDGKLQLKDLRKFFEQKSDEIGFTDANKNFIMSHGVSSINWTSYKQFLPENVYKRYMECWKNINLV